MTAELHSTRLLRHTSYIVHHPSVTVKGAQEKVTLDGMHLQGNGTKQYKCLSQPLAGRENKLRLGPLGRLGSRGPPYPTFKHVPPSAPRPSTQATFSPSCAHHIASRPSTNNDDILDALRWTRCNGFQGHRELRET